LAESSKEGHGSNGAALPMMMNPNTNANTKYCEGYAQSIARQQPRKHVPIHVPRNSTVEVFPSCQWMDFCYTRHVRWRHTTVFRVHIKCFLWFAVTLQNSSGHETCFLWFVSVPRLYNEVPRITECSVGDRRWPQEVRSWSRIRSQPVKT
jgi:hypothetical protein